MLYARTSILDPTKVWVSWTDADSKALQFLLSEFDPETNKTNNVNVSLSLHK